MSVYQNKSVFRCSIFIPKRYQTILIEFLVPTKLWVRIRSDVIVSTPRHCSCIKVWIDRSMNFNRLFSIMNDEELKRPYERARIVRSSFKMMHHYGVRERVRKRNQVRFLIWYRSTQCSIQVYAVGDVSPANAAVDMCFAVLDYSVCIENDQQRALRMVTNDATFRNLSEYTYKRYFAIFVN